MILIQSYSSPSELSSDEGMYNTLKHNFPNLKVLFKQKDSVKSLRIKEFLFLTIKANIIKNEDNLIFGWGADACVYSWLFGMFSLKRKYYLSQNLIIREDTSRKKGIKNIFKYYLYKCALHSKNFYVTVNSEGLVEYYARIFNCKRKKFFVVYDSMSVDNDDIQKRKLKTPDKENSYVFCGGKACRDVDTFTKVVEANPNINFVCVFPPNIITDELKSLTNLKIYTDISQKEFNQLLDNALICCIPLNSNAPCGLLVMQRAAIMGIPIISTETYSMRTVVPNDNYGYLLPIGDVTGINKALRKLYDSKSHRDFISRNVIDNASKFHPDIVGEELSNVINRLINMNNHN